MNSEEALKMRNIMLDLEAAKYNFEQSLANDKIKVACKCMQTDVILATELMDQMLRKHNKEHIDEHIEKN